MEFKLCYKTYQADVTLGAMKRFKDETGKDLWNTLLKVIYEFEKCKMENAPTLERSIRIGELVDFDTAAYLFYAVINKSQNIPLDEIRDGMARVGWLPTERPDDMSEPYTFVLVNFAFDLNDIMTKNLNDEVKKKADTEQS